MSQSDIENYYANLLILQYRTLDKARAHIKALVRNAFANGLLKKVIDGFNIDTAVGKQLDILGKYIGLSRNVKTILSDTGSTVLDDSDYRLLLKFKLLSNITFASTAQIRNALYELFPRSVRVYDNRDMTYEYVVSTQFQNVIGVILAEELLPLPMGVGYNVIIISDDVDEYYGFSSYTGINDNPNGFSDYTNGFQHKFLSYADQFQPEQ